MVGKQEMTPEQTTTLAKQAGIDLEGPAFATWQLEFQRFVNLVRNEVLEEAAAVCDKQADRARTSTGAARADACADRIRGLKSNHSR